MSASRTVVDHATRTEWLWLLVGAVALESGALALALTHESWIAPFVAHVAASGVGAESLRLWAPANYRSSAAGAAWVVGLTVPFLAAAVCGVIGLTARFGAPKSLIGAEEVRRRELAQAAAQRRAQSRTIPASVLALSDALMSQCHETRIAAIEALRGRRDAAAIAMLQDACENDVFEVRTQAAQCLESIAAGTTAAVTQARKARRSDADSRDQQIELIECLLAAASTPLEEPQAARDAACEAATLASEILRHAPDDSDAMILLPQALLAAGRPRAAMDAANTAAIALGANPALVEVIARARFRLRDVEGAALAQEAPSVVVSELMASRSLS